MILIFLIITLLLLLCDCYVTFGVINNTCPWWVKGLIFLPSAVYIAVVIILMTSRDVRQGGLNLLFWLTLCIVLPAIIFTSISLLGKALGLIIPSAAGIVNCIAAVISVIWIMISLYGIIAGWKRIEVNEITITSERIPESFNGYRIVQLSDFHIGTYGSAPECVDRIVERVNSLNPDLIVFTGDLVNSSSQEIEQFAGILSRLHAKDGVYSVLGNHDYCFYRRYYGDDTPAKELAKVIGYEEKIGWTMLRNSSIRIMRGNDSIALIGVDNAGSRGFIDNSDLGKAVSGLSEDEFKILLSHDPSHWRREVLPESDIDLTLAGHTHAMQFMLFGSSPSKWAYPEWGGLYEEGGRRLYVSTGIGENIAFRFGAWPQIVEITLHD